MIAAPGYSARFVGGARACSGSAGWRMRHPGQAIMIAWRAAHAAGGRRRAAGSPDPDALYSTNLISVDPTHSEWLITKREAVAPAGMVTAMHPLAAQAGLDILKAGGNAVDA